MRKFVAGLVMLGLASCSQLGLGPSPDEAPGYAVFFTERSPALEPDAASIIQRAAAEARAKPEASVTVLGWTDSAGSPDADVVLSRQRAQAVADKLVADGVPPGRIVRRGRGQTHEDPGVENRRVKIVIGG